MLVRSASKTIWSMQRSNWRSRQNENVKIIFPNLLRNFFFLIIRMKVWQDQEWQRMWSKSKEAHTADTKCSTLWRSIRQMLLVAKLHKKIPPPFTGYKGSSPFLHKHVTEPCLWPNGFSPHTHVISVKFNLTLLYHLRLSLQIGIISYIYRVIHKSLRDFRTRLRNNQDRHGRKEHINR